MGGDYYDRGYVPNSAPVFLEKTAFKELDPKNYTSGNSITSSATQPIVIAFDVTGSMGDWTKIFYEKLPVFYGQLLMNQYLTDPAISISAIGDIQSDHSPLQVTNFLQGRELDHAVSKLFLQGGGGANEKQSYDIAAYFYNNFCNTKGSKLPFFFFTGDEGYYETPRSLKYSKFLNYRPPGDTVDTKAQWKRLLESYNVFHLKKAYDEPDVEQKIYHQWVNVLGKERVIEVADPKATVDIILGIISITSGSRRLQSYIKDMQARGQSQQRIAMVTKAIKEYAQGIQTKRIQPIVNQTEIDKLKQHFGSQALSGADKQRESLSKVKEMFKGELPESFYCPITGQIFLEPVMTCDGQTYEKKSIEQWLTGHDTSPLTGAVLASKNLTPNFLIKKMINEFVEKSK